MRMLYVPLSQQEREALIELAHAQRRRPQDQAAYLLGQALQSGEALAVDPPETTCVQEEHLDEEWERVAV
jgi:hypothetical protein